MSRRRLPRFLAPAIVGCAVAGGLFVLMTYMVTNNDPGIDDSRELGSVNFIHYDREKSVETRDRRKPEEPPKPPSPPKPPDNAASMEQPDAPMPRMDMPNLDIPMDVSGGPFLGEAAGSGIDTDATPVVRAPPQYPYDARRKGIEGYVTMEFTIQPDGSVTDIEVVDAEPPEIFNSAAVNALQRWKFKAREVGGEKIARRARQTIRFSLGSS